ncbi:hypothetical protein [Edaphobacter sp. 12200R-103]|uniref:hypothetical protein n=1 Tax=Edaphobacter sp. 12200R-103 TaxID=2703788 RepID=UPI00138C5ACE|nr:hypothetical protein [Edaphobacter sp. 12200R-103]QHS52135.1 hypothetical protein GWR55_10610 [Edaphobacter sp. 12200R-103]
MATPECIIALDSDLQSLHSPRRICGLVASATIPNRRSFDFALARYAQDDTSGT